MVSMTTYNCYKNELDDIKKISKDLIAKLSEDKWIIEQFDDLQKLCDYIKDKPLIDMLLYDVTKKGAISYLQEIRKSYKEIPIMIMADIKTSPMEYMKPAIHASSLLIRPWTDKQAKEVLKEFILEYLRMFEKEKNEGISSYVITSKEGHISIPYDKIYFFEAREKKIFVCTGREEFGFYHTIDKLAEELPKQFVRCHRGFIVNTEKIQKIMLSQNIIYLTDDFDIPLSRSYKSVLKGFGK